MVSCKDLFETEAAKRGYKTTTSNENHVLEDCLGPRQSVVSVAVKGSCTASLSYRAVYNFDFDYDDLYDAIFLKANVELFRCADIPYDSSKGLIPFWEKVDAMAKLKSRKKSETCPECDGYSNPDWPCQTPDVVLCDFCKNVGKVTVARKMKYFERLLKKKEKEATKIKDKIANLSQV